MPNPTAPAGLVLALVLGLAATPRAGLEDLAWLAGCWEGGGASRYEEHWMAPAGGTMLGMSRTLRGGRMVEHEFVRVWQDSAGAIHYTARPSGQAEATFTLVRATDREVVFEDPAHDFPQRIVYRRVGEDSLAARIEGTVRGRPRAVDFPMRRARCAGE